MKKNKYKAALFVIFLYINFVCWGQGNDLEEKDNENNWVPINETTYQVKAGQSFNFQLVISEGTGNSYFRTGDHEVILELVSSTSDNAVFNNPGSINYLKEPE